MSPAPFDPTAPLPGPPDPWRPLEAPAARPGPPWHMTEMIAAEPHLARRLLGGLAAPGSAAARLAAALRDARDRGRPIVTTGCGTSEHAAQGMAEILREALGAGREAVLAAQAFELALEPPAGALVVGVSHEGGTAATIDALESARNAGSRTAVVTANPVSPAAGQAQLVLATGEIDQSWCHTVGYLSPLLAAVAAAGHLTGQMPDPETVGRLLEQAGRDSGEADGLARHLGETERLLVLASGADRPSGRELALKVEEGTWLPAAYRDLETYLHGHLPSADERTGLVLMVVERRGRTGRVARARAALRAAAVLGVRAGAIVAEEVDRDVPPELTPAGRILVPEASELPPSSAALLPAAMALQRLTERLARVRGTNPDLLRRDDERYRAASAAARD